MVSGMATKKVTITLDEAELEQLRSLVHDGTSRSVSGFVQHAVRVALADRAEFLAMLDESLAKTGGPLTEAEKVWADGILQSRTAADRTVA